MEGGDGVIEIYGGWVRNEMGRVSMPLITSFIATDEMKQKVIQFLKNNRSITNKQGRLLLGLGYEQVVRLFNKMIESGELLREGKTSSVKYRMRT
jgi:hypothetical protein